MIYVDCRCTTRPLSKSMERVVRAFGRGRARVVCTRKRRTPRMGWIMHPNVFHLFRYGWVPTACACRNWQWNRFTVVR